MLARFRRQVVGDVGLVVVEEGALVAYRLAFLDRRANRLLDRLRLRRDRHIDLTTRFGDWATRDRTTFDGWGDGQAIATALALPFGDQPLLFHQQGEAALQRPCWQLVGQSLADGADSHAFPVGRHDGENGVKLLFGDSLRHAADYMSLRAFIRQIKRLFDVKSGFVSYKPSFQSEIRPPRRSFGCFVRLERGQRLSRDRANGKTIGS